MKSFIPVQSALIILMIGLSTLRTFAAEHIVQIQSGRLFPAELHIQTGDSVRWENRTTVVHTILDLQLRWGGPMTLAPNTVRGLGFSSEGTYEYFSAFGKSDMHFGTIKVFGLFPRPANDGWEGAISLSDHKLHTMSTARATSTNEPSSICDWPVGKGVWFYYTSPELRRVGISTCGSTFDTVIGVYTTEGIAQTPPQAIACNDNDGVDCSSNSPSVYFNAKAGIVYRIFVAGVNGQSGSLAIKTTQMPPLPANDTCVGAISLVSGVTNTMSITPATSDEGFEPPCQSGWTHGVWYKFTPTISGQVAISTLGSNFDTLLSVYSGVCDSLSLVPDGCNNDHGPVASGQQASVVFTATAGTAYYILAAGFNGSVGNLRIVAKENYGAPVPAIVQILEARVDGNGQFNLLFDAPTNYFVEASTNLVDWLRITHTFDLEGRYTVQDTATNHTQRFYRIRRPE